MAKVIKLKDRNNVQLLPLTRSQLVEISQITGLDFASGEKMNVQTALEKIYSYAATNNGKLSGDVEAIKNALTGLLDTQRAVANYIDQQDGAYLDLAYAKITSDIAALGSTTVTNGQFVTQVKVENGHLVAVTSQVTGADVSSAAITGQSTVDAALSYLKGASDTNLASAKTYVGEEINKLDATIAPSSGKVFTGITQTDGKLVSYTEANLTSSDITRTATEKVAGTTVEAALASLADSIDAGGTGSVVSVVEQTSGLGDSILKAYKIYQGDNTKESNLKGTINIPKDLVVTGGSVITKAAGDSEGADLVVGEKYLKLSIANQTTPVYIAVKDLVDVYKGGSNNEVTINIGQNNTIAAEIKTIAATKISYNVSNVDTELTNINSTLSDHGTRIGALETKTNNLSYTVDASQTGYVNVTSSTSGNVTTFTVTTNDIASAEDLTELQTLYNAMNTELTNAGVFYEEYSSFGTLGDTSI